MTLKQSVAPRAAIHPIVRSILARRGLDEGSMQAFIEPDYARDLHDPYKMSDMAAAVDRIVLAAERRERVIVYGDYDIDGITASGVMIEGLAANSITAESYIPDRFEEGYGINQAALAKLKEQGAQLVISVDAAVLQA